MTSTITASTDAGRRRRIIPALLALAVAVAACGGDTTTSTTQTPVTTTTVPDTTTTPPTTVPTEPTVVDWDDRDATVTLDGGWSLTHCEGEAPLWCVSRDGEVVGVLEYFIADPLSYDVYDLDADAETNLRAIAQNFIDAFVQDRAAGCGADYRFEPIEPKAFDFGANPGLAYGFRGVTADGAASEYNLQYSTLSHGRLIFMVAAAYDEGGCPGKDDLVSFDSSTLAEFQPHLEALLTSSPLPGGDPETGLALPDGFNFAWILEVEDGLVVDPAYVLSGDEARAQAIADGVIAEGEDLPNDLYIWNPTEDRIRVQMADEVKWTVIASGADQALAARESSREEVAAILGGGDSGDVYGLTPDFAPFDLLVIGGRVIEVNQRYLP